MIYRLRFDRSNFMLFDIPPDDIEFVLGDIFLLNDATATWADFWKPMDGKFTDWSDDKKTLKIPDITLWFTNELVLNQKAYDYLAKYLRKFGELLPITVEGEPYWIVHITKFVDDNAVDFEKSNRTVDEAECVNIYNLSFNERTLSDIPIFRTAYTDFKNIYCTEKFKSLIENAGLKGLLFSSDLTGNLEP